MWFILWECSVRRAKATVSSCGVFTVKFWTVVLHGLSHDSNSLWIAEKITNSCIWGEGRKRKWEQTCNFPKCRSYCIPYVNATSFLVSPQINSEERVDTADQETVSWDRSIPEDIKQKIQPKEVPAESVTVWIDPLDATQEYTGSWFLLTDHVCNFDVCLLYWREDSIEKGISCWSVLVKANVI